MNDIKYGDDSWVEFGRGDEFEGGFLDEGRFGVRMFL